MFKSLQVRLLILLVLFSITPTLILGLSLGFFSSSSARQRVEDTLSAVIALKAIQVNKWVNDLQSSLENVILRDVDLKRLPILLIQESSTSSIFKSVHSEQIRVLNESLKSTPDFEEIFLMDLNGRVVASSNLTQEGRSLASEEIFRIGRQTPYISSPAYDTTYGQITVSIALPVTDSTGKSIGVLAARANLHQLSELMQERTGMGQTGETYLVSRDLILLTPTRLAGFTIGEDHSHTEGAEQAISAEQAGVATYLNYAGVPVIGIYRWLPALQVVLLAEQAQSEAFSTANLISNLTIAALIVSTVLALLAAYWVSNNLTRPITQLTFAAQQITSSGARTADASTTSDVITGIDTDRQDEIGTLGKAFSSMTLELRELIQSLDGRVEERTRLLQTRSEQLQAAADVSRSVATILDTDQLIQQVVELIQQRFEMYYVGLFLVDHAREWAVLRAGTGQAGRAMLARQHRIRIGTGMIGWSIVNAQARIAHEVETDTIRLAISDLPETRSEAAIPLRSRGQVLGAISIQSRYPHSFDGEVVSIFQTMADQIAVAIDNARLFAESQRALDSVQQAYGRMSHQAWLERISARPIAYKRDQSGLIRLDRTTGKEEENFKTMLSASDSFVIGEPATGSVSGETDHTLSLSLKVREQVIGQVHLCRKDSAWSEDEVALLQAILDQVGASLDAARLFEETQQLAQRERLVSEITSNMRATLDIDNVLKTAAREMLNTLALAEVEVRLSGRSERSSSDLSVDASASGQTNIQRESWQ